MSAPTQPDYWPEGGQAAAHLARMQKLLDARGLSGSDRRLRPLMKRISGAFAARDLAGVVAACDALVDEIESQE